MATASEYLALFKASLTLRPISLGEILHTVNIGHTYAHTCVLQTHTHTHSHDTHTHIYIPKHAHINSIILFINTLAFSNSYLIPLPSQPGIF